MHILITGAAGFIGQLLARTLLDDEEGKYTLVMTDIVEPPIPNQVKWPQHAKAFKADLCTGAQNVVEKNLDAAFVFHGVMSSGSEADFDLGMQANFTATQALLETLYKICPGVRVVYTSSQAVYGGQVPEPVDETMRPTPESSYGCEKMMCEYLITEYNRRNFIDGIIVRLPTVSVRPGKPTAAASSFLSGMIREPMQNLPCVIPIENRSFRHWLCSPRTLASNLVHALGIPRDALPSYDRVLNLPGIGVSVQDMMNSLERVGGKEKLKYLSEDENPALKPILYSWPSLFDNKRALDLGFTRDTSFDEVVKDFKRGLEASK